jgi:hypothetical protein
MPPAMSSAMEESDLISLPRIVITVHGGRTVSGSDGRHAAGYRARSTQAAQLRHARSGQ